MSVETITPTPNPVAEQHLEPVRLPDQMEQADTLASDYDAPRNDLATDVAKPLAESYYTDPEAFYAQNPVETPPDTPKAFSQRWGQLQGTWQRVKAGAYGATIGRLRALKRGESYDATKHNRIVQNEMYKNIGDLAVREHLFAHDTKRFNRYASGTLTHAESLRQNVENGGAMVAIAGVLALRGAGKLLLRSSKLESTGSYIGLAAAESAEKALKSLNKSSKSTGAARNRSHSTSQAMTLARQKAYVKSVQV